MRVKLISLATLLAVATIPALAAKYESDTDVASYGVGLNIGSSLKAQGLPNLNVDAIIAGIQDAVKGNQHAVSDEQLKTAFTNLQKQEAEHKAALSKENLAKGAAFLKENAKKDGVKTTASGLQYKVIKTGNGKKPKADDVVVTNYRGVLIDGQEFDSSYKRKKPVEFPVNRVIPGWSEALQMMPVGSKWKLYIPPKLAYGEFSPSPNIPPNSTLVFDIELLNIKQTAQN